MQMNKKLNQMESIHLPALLPAPLMLLGKGLRRTPQISQANILSSLSYVQMEQLQIPGLLVSVFDSTISTARIKELNRY